MKNLRLIAISFIAFSLYSFQGVKVSEFQTKEKIAIVPFFGSNQIDVNRAYFAAFSDSFYQIADSSQFRHAIENHKTINSWIREIQELTTSNPMSGNETFINLSQTQISEIKSDCQNAEFLIVSSSIH